MRCYYAAPGSRNLGMPQVGSTSSFSSLLKLRAVVAFLGEKPQAGWWDSAFLNPVGFQYLGLIYPKTAAAGALTAASEAARRLHDERIGRGRVVHLFRFTAEAEMALRRDMTRAFLSDLGAQCTLEAAYSILDKMADGAHAAAGAGPVQVGNLKDCSSQAALARLAATYAAGFRSATLVFPYFT